jgi:hypothetical protein
MPESCSAAATQPALVDLISSLKAIPDGRYFRRVRYMMMETWAGSRPWRQSRCPSGSGGIAAGIEGPPRLRLVPRRQLGQQ